MLLAQEANSVENLAGARACCLESFLQVRVFQLELLDPFGADPRRTRRAVEHLHAGFSLKGPASERGQFLPEVADELTQLIERSLFRTFAV